MPVKKARLFAAAIVLATSAASASQHRFTYRPVSISFVPGFSTNGPEWESVSSDFSLNIIGGGIGRVHGVELGGVFDIDADEVVGYQAAGVFNIVGGGFYGLQQSGVFNIVDQNFTGVQMAGVFNIVDNTFSGAQMGSVINVVDEDVTGAQLAGVVNVAGSRCVGTQVAGVVNVAAGQMSGLQLAGVVNAADEFSGAQVGLVNIAGSGRGLQLGLVNIAEDMDVPIGLVSIVKNGMFHANVWATEFAPVNVGIKTGSNIIYNVFMVGWRPDGESTRVYGGLGIGGHIPINRFFVDVDLLSHGVFSGPDWFPEGGSDLLSSLRLTGGWQVTRRLAVTAGPTLNVWVSDHEDGSRVPFYDAPLYKWDGSEHVRVWPGFSVGLQLL
jgi:hypothetical protein